MPASTYQIICDAARQLDIAQISAMEWVDYLHDTWTPASRLAYEGQTDAVALLLSRGANSKAAAEGYARAGNHAMVAQFQKQYPDCINWIARGYAWAGDHERVEKYRFQYAANADYIAEGYAFAGDHARVDAYHRVHHVSANQIAKAYAQVNDIEQVETYEGLGADPESVIAGYALAKNDAKVREYIEKYHIPEFRFIQSYVLTGEHEKIEEYCDNNPNLINLVTTYYAQANHNEKVAFYRQKYGVDLELILEGYALGGHHEQVIDTLLQIILQEIVALKSSWFFDNTDRIKLLQTLYGNLLSPSPKDVTLLGLLNRLDIPLCSLTIRNPIFLQKTLLLQPKSPYMDHKKYKDAISKKRGKEDLASTTSESDDSSEPEPSERVGLRSRKKL